MVKYVELFEMAYSRKKAESFITGLERPINYHLLKLFAIDAKEETREHWKSEIRTWFEDIKTVKSKEKNKPFSASFYFIILFDEPFGGHAVGNVGMLVRRIVKESGIKGEPLTRNSRSDEEIANMLERFHEEAAKAISDRMFSDEMINNL